MEICQKTRLGTDWVTRRTQKNSNRGVVTLVMMSFMCLFIVLLNVGSSMAIRSRRLNGNGPSNSLEGDLNENGNLVGVSCDFEEPCEWKWDTGEPGFQLITGEEVMKTRESLTDPKYEYSGPHDDAKNSPTGKNITQFFFFQIFNMVIDILPTAT